MPILTYTTKISTEKTAGEIQKKLVSVGARSVMTEYNDDGIMCSMAFRIKTDVTELAFRLPINFDGVYRVCQANAADLFQEGDGDCGRCSIQKAVIFG